VDLQSLKIDRQAAAKPVRRRGNPWPLRLVAIGVLAAAAWLFAPALLAFADRMRLPVVRTFLVTESPAAAAAAVTGTAANGDVVAARRAARSSDGPGRIVELNVREGSIVQKGDVVARLYADEYRAALQRAEADLQTAVSSIARAEAAGRSAAADATQAESAAASSLAQQHEAEALLRWADAELVRTRELVQSGSATARDVERAASERDAQAARVQASTAATATAAAAVAAAKARVGTADGDIAVAKAQHAAATASRDLAQATLDKTDVRAPFSGIVVLKDAEVGEVVSPNVVGGGNARGAVCTMVDFDSLEVQANVPETTLASVKVGAPTDVFLDAFPDERYPGVVDRIWPTADRSKATVEVRIKLGRKDDRLRPEMGARIVFRQEQEVAATANPTAVRKTIVVPDDAIVRIDGKAGAFLLERDTVRFTELALGERKNGRVVVTQGLVPEQTLVLAPPANLQSGDRVRRQPD
jgi:RND family efflux transporter MFP subunit